MHIKKAAVLAVAMILFCFIFLFPTVVSADMGPKPRLTVIVTNPPEGEYYLDLLVDYDLPLSDNLEGRRDTLDSVKLSLLENYRKNGWYAALAHGTRTPIWGSLTGEHGDGVVTHTFGYFGVPDRYKIIIVTPENEVITTRAIEKKSYTSTVYYDYATGDITEETGLTLAWTYTRQFLMTLFPTIIIEGIILLLFRFKTSHTLGVFFFTNLITQAGLTLIMSTSLLKLGIYASYVVLLPVELVIIAVEVAVYALLLKEGKNSKRVAYAIIANVISGLALLPLMYFEYMLFIN